MDALGLRVDNLCFWNEITTGDITTKEERKAAFLATKPKGNRLSFLPEELSPKTEEEIIWDEEFECLEMERIPRKFPATNVVYHFHPIAFAEQMKLITAPTTPRWMTVALEEYKAFKGLKEWDSDLSERIKDYHNTTKYNKGDGHGTAWCSSYVNWVMENSGYKGTKSSRSLDWLNWGKKVSEPIYGAIAVKTRRGGGHVGFVFAKKGGNGVVILGGNQTDELKKSSYKDKSIFTYVIPSNYNTDNILELKETNKDYAENNKED